MKRSRRARVEKNYWNWVIEIREVEGTDQARTIKHKME